jgi:hypothetical protein
MSRPSCERSARHGWLELRGRPSARTSNWLRGHCPERGTASCGNVFQQHVSIQFHAQMAGPVSAGRRPALVRLRGRGDRTVEVRFCAVKNRAVSNRNCVAAMRGGEQRGENDQSVTQAVRGDGRRELDSVGVGGRVCERMTKPAKRALGGEPKRRAAGRSPDVAPMVGDGMAGSPSAVIRETRWGQAAFMATRPEEPPVGSQRVRSSDEAGNDRGAKGHRKVDAR